MSEARKGLEVTTGGKVGKSFLTESQRKKLPKNPSDLVTHRKDPSTAPNRKSLCPQVTQMPWLPVGASHPRRLRKAPTRAA